MPKYIVAGSQFNPFTYDEISRPLQESAKLHRETDDALSMLAMQAGTIGSRIGDGEENKHARQMYDNYMDTVKSAAEDLYNKGYNGVTAKAFSNARAMYATKMAKLDAAIKNRDARIKEYNDMLRADDTLISEYNPSSRGLDYWLADDNYGYFRKASGKTLMDLGKQAGLNLKGQFLDKSGFSPAAGTGGYLLEQLTRTGLTQGDINAAVMNIYSGQTSNDPRVSAAQKAIEDIYNSTDLSSWADDDQKSKAIGYIAQGLGSAIGDIKSEHTANEAAKQAAADNRIKLQYALKGLASGGSGNGGGTAGGFMPRVYQEEMRTPNFNQVSRRYNNNNQDVPRVVKGRDGRNMHFNNEAEANAYLTQLPLRQEAGALLGGIDVGDLITKKQHGEIDGLKVDVKMDIRGNNYIVKEKYPGGPMEKDDKLTGIYNKYHSQYMQNKASIRQNNPSVNIDKLVTSARSERKFDKWSGENTAIGEAANPYLDTAFTGTLSGSYLTTPGKSGAEMKEMLLSSIQSNIAGNNKHQNARAGYTIQIGKKGVAGFPESTNKNLEKIFTSDNILDFAIDGESLVNGGVKALTKDGDKILVPWDMFGGHLAAEGRNADYLQLIDAYNNESNEAGRKADEGKLARYASKVVSRTLESARQETFPFGSKTSSKPVSYITDRDDFTDDYSLYEE